MPRSRSVLLAVALGLIINVQPAQAERSREAYLSDSGHSGSPTYVLITGMLGGIEGFRKLEHELLLNGYRVVIVDPYLLSLDSADVTFFALARRVDAVLGRLGVRGARVAGHSHGAGVALRLAANFPDRVSSLYFLNAGALASNNTPGVATSMRLAKMISRIPFGSRLVRSRLLAGLRDNVVQSEWMDAETERQYSDPILTNLDRIAGMAQRFSTQTEPESISRVLQKTQVPVVVILAGVQTPGGAGADEMEAIKELGARVHYETVAGVGHFLHEEAPAEVAARLLSPGSLALARRR